MKKSFVLIMISILMPITFINFNTNICLAQIPIKKVLKNLSASKLIFMLDKIPIGSEKEFGFNNRQEFVAAQVGIPIQIYTVIADSLIHDTSFDKNYFIPFDEWRIPVLVNNQPRALLTAAKQNGVWQIVDFGAMQLARELGEFDSTHILTNTAYKKYILRLYQLQCDFIVIQNLEYQPNKIEIYPLQSATMAFDKIKITKKDFYSLQEVIPIIKSKYLETNLIEQNK